MPAPKVKAGQRYGRLVTNGIVRKDGIDGARLWACKCDCGNITQVKATYLTSGKTQSCGCLRADVLKKHGHKGQAKVAQMKTEAKAQKLYGRYYNCHETYKPPPWDELPPPKQDVWRRLAQQVNLRFLPQSKEDS